MLTLTNNHGTFSAEPAHVSRVLDYYARTIASSPGPRDLVAHAMRCHFASAVRTAEFAYADVTDRLSLAVMLAHAGHDAPARS